jgi:hypothetical protein
MKQILILMLSIFLFTSCAKNDDSEPVATTCQAKTMEYLENGKSDDKLFFTYNDKGKVARVDHGTLNSTDYETYEYQTGKIVMFDKINFLGKAETITFNLDANSRITSVGNNTFKYNAEGYLIESKQVSTGVTNTTTFTYTNANLTKIDYLIAYSTDTEKNSTIIDYNTDAYQSIGGFGSVLANFEFNEYGVLTDFYGKTSKNLVTKDTFKSPGYTDQVTTYTYVKDEKSKVTSMKFDLAPDKRELKLTYDCK